ncbi:MAG: hypothetical protein D6689_16720, partial [Deltaproteobacteria bacterium]
PLPARAIARAVAYVTAAEPVAAELTVHLASDDPYARYLRVYVDGRPVAARVVRAGARRVVALGPLARGLHAVAIEVDRGDYRAWRATARIRGAGLRRAPSGARVCAGDRGSADRAGARARSPGRRYSPAGPHPRPRDHDQEARHETVE